MFRSPRLRVAIGVISAAVALTACSSDGRTTFTKPGLTRLQAIAHELGTKVPGVCSDLKTYPESEYFVTRVAYDLMRAQAAGECSGFSQALEITVLSDTAERDRYVQEFNAFICRQSEKAKVGTPGLPWVLGRDYTLRPDDDAGARKAAKALGLEYRFTACPGVEHPNWTERSIGALEQFQQRLVGALPGECADFELADYDLTRNEPQIRRLGIPPAMGLCAIGEQPAVLAVYSESFEVPQAKFVDAEYSVLCTKGQVVRVVNGSNWTVFTAADPRTVARIAATMGGQEVQPSTPCGNAAPSTTSTTSTTSTSVTG